MAAEAGNQWWKLRSKHGRDKLFKTPKLLWDAACEYFQWCEENPLKESQLVSFQGNSVLEVVPKMRPFTMEGLCIYLDCNTAYFRQFKEALNGKTDQISKDFSTVIASIEEVVRNQQFSGAAAGFLNANIISRNLGLKDKTDVTSDGKSIAAPQINVISSTESDNTKP